MHTRFLLIVLATISIALFALVFVFDSVQKDEAPENFRAEAGALRELKEKWKRAIEEDGAEVAYAAFLHEAPLNGEDPHGQAHAFGEALYEIEGLNGLKFCDSSFEFGCYHSFFGVAVHVEGIQTLSKFDEACKDKFGNKNLPCQHGIGHGVLVYTDYENLEDALELCETISALPTGGCSSGVFMEYNFHTMDESAEGYVRKAEENLYAPCDTLPPRFQASCYFEQVQWWQALFNGDFTKIGELCTRFEENTANYNACYNGAGNYAAAQAEYDFDGIVALCAQMHSEASVGLCHEGASWLVVSVKEFEDSAPKLCEVLSEPYRSQCFQKLQF
jgi:hypothetical protein